MVSSGGETVPDQSLRIACALSRARRLTMAAAGDDGELVLQTFVHRGESDGSNVPNGGRLSIPHRLNTRHFRDSDNFRWAFSSLLGPRFAIA